MPADEVIKIIEKLPDYIKYIYPGYITIYLYFYFKGCDTNDTKAIALKSISISYLYIILSDTLHIENILLYNMILIGISIIIPYVYYRLSKRKLIEFLYTKLHINTSPCNNEIEFVETKNGTWMYIYLNDCNLMYEGSLASKEMDPKKDRFICLSQFRVYFIDEKDKYEKVLIDSGPNGDAKHDNEKVIIYFKNISRIELIQQ